MTRWPSQSSQAPTVTEWPLSGPTDPPNPAQPRERVLRPRGVRGSDPPPGWFSDVEAAFAQVRWAEEALRKAMERRSVAVWVATEGRRATKRWLGNQVGLSNQYVGQMAVEGERIAAREGWTMEEAALRVGLGR